MESYSHIHQSCFKLGFYTSNRINLNTEMLKSGIFLNHTSLEFWSGTASKMDNQGFVWRFKPGKWDRWTDLITLMYQVILRLTGFNELTYRNNIR